MYSEAPRQQPLALAASKSWVGHAEPAAGLVGLLFAHAAATQLLTTPLMHLRAVNPYVASTLEQQQAQQTPGASIVAPALLPRQGGGLVETGQEEQASTWGVSAFAFQGTNAHAVLSAAAVGSTPLHASADLEALPAWQSRRHYVLPEAHLLIASAAVAPAPTGSAGRGASRVLFHAELAAASLAFIWDHQVMGKPLFPGESSRDL